MVSADALLTEICDEIVEAPKGLSCFHSPISMSSSADGSWSSRSSWTCSWAASRSGVVSSLGSVAHVSIPADTDPAAFAVLVQRWRSMSVAERVDLLDQLNADVERLAVAGIRAMQPGLTEPEIRHELARRRFGATLADEAYRHRPV